MPLGDLKVLEETRDSVAAPISAVTSAKRNDALTVAEKNPSAIQFVRNRMLYARPVLNSRGVVTFGLRHIRK